MLGTPPPRAGLIRAAAWPDPPWRYSCWLRSSGEWANPDRKLSPPAAGSRKQARRRRPARNSTSRSRAVACRNGRLNAFGHQRRQELFWTPLTPNRPYGKSVQDLQPATSAQRSQRQSSDSRNYPFIVVIVSLGSFCINCLIFNPTPADKATQRLPVG